MRVLLRYLRPSVSLEDELFLDDLQRANFRFFWEQAHPQTGLIADRCLANGAPDTRRVASIAATGFGLSALCIGSERRYVHPAAARLRALQTLRFLHTGMATEQGFYYHFIDVRNGARVWNSEVSSIDTAILLCGVLLCREYFPHAEIRRSADAILARVDWRWLVDEGGLLSHGWTPESGFLPYRWDRYSELMMLYLLALGSGTQPLPAESWHAWKRVPFEYDGLSFIASDAPLFAHQYSQAWFDFRGKRDQYANYFENSMVATEVHRRFCIKLQPQFAHLGPQLWGITASDSRHGYVAWGGPPATGPIDGTVVPSAAAGSLPFLPAETLRVLRTIRERYAPAWSRYGFVNAFQPQSEWYAPDVVGIDTGITLLMAENLRSGLVWDIFSRSPEVQRAFARAGFTQA